MTVTRQDLTVIGATYHDDLIGPGEVRQLAGDEKHASSRRLVGHSRRHDSLHKPQPVSSRTLAVWRGDPEFPPPVRELSIGPVWDRRHVAAWLARRYG